MTARILDVITSCKECPHRHYYTAGLYECMKVGQPLAAGVRMPDWCPLAAYPAPAQQDAERANSSNSSNGSDAERERQQGEGDAETLSDDQCIAVYHALDEFGRNVDHYEYGLPMLGIDDRQAEALQAIRDAIRAARAQRAGKEGDDA